MMYDEKQKKRDPFIELGKKRDDKAEDFVDGWSNSKNNFPSIEGCEKRY